MQTIEEACQSLLDSHVDMVGFDMEWWTQFKTGVAPREVALIQLCYDRPQQENAQRNALHNAQLIEGEAASAEGRPLQSRRIAENATEQSTSGLQPPCKRSCSASRADKVDVVNSHPHKPQCHCLLLHISRTGATKRSSSSPCSCHSMSPQRVFVALLLAAPRGGSAARVLFGISSLTPASGSPCS